MKCEENKDFERGNEGLGNWFKNQGWGRREESTAGIFLHVAYLALIPASQMVLEAPPGAILELSIRISPEGYWCDYQMEEKQQQRQKYPRSLVHMYRYILEKCMHTHARKMKMKQIILEIMNKLYFIKKI